MRVFNTKKSLVLNALNDAMQDRQRQIMKDREYRLMMESAKLPESERHKILSELCLQYKHSLVRWYYALTNKKVDVILEVKYPENQSIPIIHDDSRLDELDLID